MDTIYITLGLGILGLLTIIIYGGYRLFGEKYHKQPKDDAELERINEEAKKIRREINMLELECIVNEIMCEDTDDPDRLDKLKSMMTEANDKIKLLKERSPIENRKTLEEEIKSYPYLMIHESHTDSLLEIKERTSGLYFKLIGNVYYRKAVHID